MIQRDYPYMYARVSAKKAKLYDEMDYDSMLKMGPNEISRKMGEGVYKEDIDELGSNYDGVKLAELALSRNLSRELSGLVEKADGKLQEVLRTYLRRYDILTLKRVLRARKADEEAMDYLHPVGGVDQEELDRLCEMSFEEARDSISFEDSPVDYQKYINQAETVSQVETGLDQAYYDELWELAENNGSSQFRDFITDEMRYENIKMVLRLKKYGVGREKIRERLLTARNGGLVEELLGKEYEDGLQHVMNEFGLEVGERLEDVERAIEVHRLEKALKRLHTRPLGLSSVLGYVVAKITEVKNLRMLLRAKETGIQNQETIRKQLILPN